MRTVSSSRRWGKVKRRKSQLKLEQNKAQAETISSPDNDRDEFPRRRPMPRRAPQGWMQRHPGLLLSLAALAAFTALAAIIYVIPKSTPHYETEKRKDQPTLSAFGSDKQGTRAAPTDQSFLDTHYNQDSVPHGGGGYAGNGSGGTGNTNSSASAKGPNASFGDGTVTRKDGDCQVNASGSSNFAGALADCVKAGASTASK
ncbi:hypothetical protein DLREEDagrD3_03170 [Denitratisoma sp. agr-D3]